MTNTAIQTAFDTWKKDYDLEAEPNYSIAQEADCLAAFKAGLIAAPGVTMKVYAWAVTGLGTPFYGEFAQYDAEAEARRVGGDAKAFPLYIPIL